MSQGEFVQENLKKRENIEDDIDKEEEEEVTGQKEVKMNFFEIQRREMERKKAKRQDKHLLPKKFDNQICDFGQIDFIFNHKNIWANM